MSYPMSSPLSELPIYQKAMEIINLSRSISSYLHQDLSYLRPDGSEDSNIYFSGDIIQNGRIPFLNSANVDTKNWMNAIAKVRELKPEILIQGHGPVSRNAMEALDFTYSYLAFVRSEMKQAVQNWVAFVDAYQQTDWSRYETLPAFEASNKANAYRVYLEMERSALEN